MRLLIPVDFSASSEKAIDFGIKIALKLKCEIVLLHVIYYYGHSRVLLRAKHLVNAMEEVARENVKRLIKKLTALRGLPSNFFSCHIVSGSLVDQINSFAYRYESPLVIMGTTGASGLKKFFIGSNTVSVIENCSHPVITVPEKSNVKRINRIMYSTDTKSMNREVKLLMPLVRLLNASLLIMHVRQRNSVDKRKLLRKVELYKEKYDYEKISFIEVRGGDVVKVINAQAKAQHADMIATFPHQKGFFSQLLQKSVTDEIAFHTHIPLLSIKR